MSSSRACPNDYLLLVEHNDFQELARRKLNALRRVGIHIAATGCCLSAKAGDKKGGKGYPSCKLSHRTLTRRKVEFSIHKLVFMERAAWKKAPADGEEVSHLCHQTKCLTKEHLCVESPQVHDSRDACKYKQVVIFNCSCGCEPQVYNPCTHEPRCILPSVSVDKKA